MKLAILGALRSIAEKKDAIAVAQHSYALLPCLRDENILVQRKVSALYRVLAEEGAAAIVARDVASIMHCFEATQAGQSSNNALGLGKLAPTTKGKQRKMENRLEPVGFFSSHPAIHVFPQPRVSDGQWEISLTLKANNSSLTAPLEALSAIACAGEGIAVSRVIERLLIGLRQEH